VNDDRHCLNCDSVLVGPYCADCGQKEVDPDKGLLEVVLDLVGEAFEADGRLHRTVGPFLLRPGLLTAEWTAGRRARYTSPPRIFIFALFVGFVGLAIAADRSVAAIPDLPITNETEAVEVGSKEGGGLHLVIDNSDGDLEGTQRQLAEAVVGEVVEQGPKLVVALVPALALWLKVVLWRRRALTHVVFSLLLHARMLLLGGVAVVLPGEVPRLVVFALLQVYLLLGLRRAYELSWKATLWRYGLVAAAYTATWVVGLIVLAVWAAYRELG